MSELKGQAVDRYLQSGSPAVRVLIVYGADPGLVTERCDRAAKAFLGTGDVDLALVKLTAADLIEQGVVMDELGAISMFSDKRVVWVREFGQKKLAAAVTAACNAQLENALLIIEAGELRKGHELRKLGESQKDIGLIACYRDTDKDLTALIDSIASDHGLAVSEDAQAALVDRLGGNRLMSRNEVEKVCLYAIEAGRIELEDVLLLVGDSAASQIDDLIDAVALGRVGAAELQFDRVLRDGVHPAMLAGAVLRHFQRLEVFADQVQSGTPIDQVIGGARPPIFFNRKSVVRRQITLWTAPQTRAAQQLLQNSVLAQRKQAALEPNLLGQALLRLARSKARPAQR